MTINLPDAAYEWRPLGAQQPPDPLPAPVLDRAQVVLIIDGNGVEQPKGTFFTLVQFSGGLEEWLELVRNSPGMPIQESTVQHVRFDERPGIVYQTEFTGLSGEEGVYIVKPAPDVLLVINTELINSDPLLAGLRIE